MCPQPQSAQPAARTPLAKTTSQKGLVPASIHASCVKPHGRGRAQQGTSPHTGAHTTRWDRHIPQHLRPGGPHQAQNSSQGQPHKPNSKSSCPTKPFPPRPPDPVTAMSRWRLPHSALPASPSPRPHPRDAPPPLAPPQDGGRTSCLSALPPPLRGPPPSPSSATPLAGAARTGAPAAANSNKERRASLCARRPTSCAQPFARAARPRLAHA